MEILKIIAITLLIISSVNINAIETVSPEFTADIHSPIYMLADASNGRILLAKGSDILIAPASLAKIMTLNLSLKDVENGRLSSGKLYAVPSGGEARSMKSGSSLLGLSRGDEASLITLQRAAAIASANDAAWTLALLSNKNIQDFISRMNQEASLIGMENTIYTDPDGWSSLSQTNAEDQMRLVLYYLNQHQGVLSRIHALPRMVYQDMDRISYEPAKRNTNLLIGRMDGVDGLKTGTIPSAGFHFIATAKRAGTRFIAIVMGLKTSSYVDSLNQRTSDAQTLLEWGFSHYYSWKPKFPDAVEIDVRHGRTLTADLVVDESDLDKVKAVTLNRSDKTPIIMVVDTPERLTAPLMKGVAAGSVRWYQGNTVLFEIPLRLNVDVERRWRFKDIF